MTPDEVRTHVLAFLRAAPFLFAVGEDPDGRGAQLIERQTGKSLAVRWDEVREAVEKSTPLRPHPYLVLVFHDQRQVALTDVGFAFAPSTLNTGPLPELPPTLCFADLRHLTNGAQSLLQQSGREPDALRAILMGIALIDGARAAGFEVAHEERALDGLLREVEQRGASPHRP
jgi:hypothetical protein